MTETLQDGSREQEVHYSQLQELSNAMVRLYKEQFGRGPTKTRTNYAGPDIVITTLEESLTPAERKLADLGEHQRLRDMRMFFQYSTAEDFIYAVETITGRKVRGFVSGTDTEQDISSEVFYLEPRENPRDLDGRASENAAAGTDGDGLG